MRRSIDRTFSRSGANSLSFAVIRLVSVVRSPDIALVAPHPWTQLHILRQIENMGRHPVAAITPASRVFRNQTWRRLTAKYLFGYLFGLARNIAARSLVPEITGDRWGFGTLVSGVRGEKIL